MAGAWVKLECYLFLWEKAVAYKGSVDLWQYFAVHEELCSRCQWKSVVSAFGDVEVDGIAKDLCDVILEIDGHPRLFHRVTGNQ